MDILRKMRQSRRLIPQAGEIPPECRRVAVCFTGAVLHRALLGGAVAV